MNKEMYLNALKENLKRLPEDYKNEILKDYENHFVEGTARGKTEEETAKRLGDVKIIARIIVAEYHSDKADSLKGNESIFSIIKAIGNVSIGTMNLIVAAPFVTAIMVFVAALYLMDIFLILAPLFCVIDIIFPSEYITMGNPNILWTQPATACIGFIIGFSLRKKMKLMTVKIYRWTIRYISGSIGFIKNSVSKDI